MNTLFKISVITIFSILIIQPVQGQILKRITERAKERVEQKIEQRANNEVDEKIDEGLDEIEDSLKKEEQAENDAEETSREEETQQRMQGILKGLGLSGEPVPVADSYHFNHLIQMHVESTDKSGEKTNEGEFITHLNPDSESMAYQVVSGDMNEPGQGLFIIDAENGAIIILGDDENEKTGLVYGMGAFFESMGQSYEEQEMMDSPEMYLANPNVKKSGNSKNVAGYKCDEYIYTDEETVSNIWITQDLRMNSQDFFSSLFKTSMYTNGMAWGYPMEVTSEDKVNGETTFMQVTNVDDNTNVSFNLNNYQLTNLGSLQMPVEE